MSGFPTRASLVRSARFVFAASDSSCRIPVEAALMLLSRSSSWTLLTIALGSLILARMPVHAAESVLDSKLPEVIEFNRDIRPILSDRCYACHGPDKNKREADLRLDLREGLLGVDKKAGVIVPGKLEASELWKRVTSEYAEERMP